MALIAPFLSYSEVVLKFFKNQKEKVLCYLFQSQVLSKSLR